MLRVSNKANKVTQTHGVSYIQDRYIDIRRCIHIHYITHIYIYYVNIYIERERKGEYMRKPQVARSTELGFVLVFGSVSGFVCFSCAKSQPHGGYRSQLSAPHNCNCCMLPLTCCCCCYCCSCCCLCCCSRCNQQFATLIDE